MPGRKASAYKRGELAESVPKKAIQKAGKASFQRLAEQIQRETGDGAELMKFALDVWRNTSLPFSDRWNAFIWASERGFGKAPQIIDIQMDVRTSVGVDLSKLSDSQLDQLHKLLNAAVAENEIIDVTERKS